MNFYTATTLTNAARAQQLRDILTDGGHRPAYDWTKHGAVGKDGVEALTNAALNESSGVHLADVVIALLPGGRGTHAEIGMAIALNKPVIIWDEPGGAFAVDDTTCAFYWHPNVLQMSAARHDLFDVAAMAIGLARQGERKGAA